MFMNFKLRLIALFTIWLSLSMYASEITSETKEESVGTMHLVGDVAGVYRNGEFVIWIPNPDKAKRKGASSMAPATSMAPASNSQPKSPVAGPGYIVIAEAPISEDGRFEMSVEVDKIQEVFFYVLYATSAEGYRMAPIKGMNFILEPGELELKLRTPSQFAISGGHYNDAVFNSWRMSEEYQQTRLDYEATIKSVEGETETERRARVDKSSEIFNHLLELETQGRKEVALTHEDPRVRLLTIQTAWLLGPWVLEAWRGLAELTPDDPLVQSRLAAAEENNRKRQEERKITEGTEILDFTAETLEGTSVRLADVRAESEIVLVEFWASWCGPCRVEIPHMKEAYKQYQDAGFEIVSFTIDDDREDWEIASEEEEIPWLNLGMGEDAEAPKAYNVTGVPKNYLVDSETGLIVAKDLRGHHLDEKLVEIFSEE